MARVTVPRWVDDGGHPALDMPPLRWARRGSQVYITCVNGHAALIAGEDRWMSGSEGGWEISIDGQVSPSIWCRTTTGVDGHEKECGWHVFATLEDWDGPSGS